VIDSLETARNQWRIRSDTTYLNHGSFGPAPQVVSDARRVWLNELEAQPMDFYVRRLEPAWLAARRELARFVTAPENDLVFVENATAAMNVVARSFPLHSGDQVMLTDHAYGAVRRIWHDTCEGSGAELATVQLPRPIESQEQIVDAIVQSMGPKTRLLVVSHITSATALHLPVAEICRQCAARCVAVCIDGPHAPLHVDVNLTELGCDFYAASCHKWLCAPLGTGFLYVAPSRQPTIRPLAISWGRLLPATPTKWYEQFIWSGTRDPTPYLTVPTAIHFFEQLGVANVRASMYALADYARQRLIDAWRQPPIAPPTDAWYGAMAHVPIPVADGRSLQHMLWTRFGIEVPIVDWQHQHYVRVSCHLYNSREQIDRLVQALQALI
jgi:isopenicillin-N epimerase